MDSDMIVMRNMDELMELDLASDWISAVHACACNPRKLAHYPKDWWVLHTFYIFSRANKKIGSPPIARIHPSYTRVDTLSPCRYNRLALVLTHS